jgi:DNA-binding CsgD family transcriptional regulator/tetratricopeptide (TPR) repeat protein
MLLERTPALEALAALRQQSSAEGGRVVLIAGEAGIGKTSLLRAFASDALWGACDPLVAPRPLGPLHDIAPGLGAGLPALLARETGRVELFGALLDALGRVPRCLVFEDLHWADEATLDLLAWLGRRIERTRTLLLGSYRDDEIGAGHPLRRVLGALPGAARIALPRLSQDAVRRLCGTRSDDASSLHRVSGGNPFFVTELLALNGAHGVPPTVSDAVLARLAPLPAAARSVLDVAAVLGPRIEPALLLTIAGADIVTLDACLAAGVLQEASGTLEFRHELARQAVLGAISLPRRQDLHRRVLHALRSTPGIDAARLSDHAEAAQDRDAVLVYAPLAARQAATAGAQRQAFTQYARALRFADERLPDAEHAALLEAFALVCLSVGEGSAGVHARRQSIALRAHRGEVRQQAESLCRLNNLLVGMGRNAEADEALAEAFALLAPLPPCRELAYAWRTRAHLSMLRGDDAVAIDAADRAIALGEQFANPEIVISALNSKGTSMAQTDFEAGCAVLEQSRRLARQAGRPMQVFNADINLIDTAIGRHLFERAMRHVAAADACAAEMQMERVTTLGRLAMCQLHLGRWDEAGDLANRALADSPDMTINRAAAQLVLGRLRARRGDAGIWSALDESLRVAIDSGFLQHLAPVRAARAEAAWLEGDLPRCRAEARAAYALAQAQRHAWYLSELGYWCGRAGDPVEAPGDITTPFALQAAGRWREAAAAWQERACPYEQAQALAQADLQAEPEAAREALAIFERLGARPAAETLRQRLHEAGVRGLARGPRASTREQPFGLTARELQVLQQLCDGLRNAEIAARLHRSVRTVDHHLEAVFAKLGVETRTAAIAAAQRAGLTPNGGRPRSEEG